MHEQFAEWVTELDASMKFSSLDAILVNDELTYLTWKLPAKSKGKRLLTFSNPRGLQPLLYRLSKNTPIFIDSNLGHGLRGEVYGKELFELGFTELYLATGYEADQFLPMHWIKGVLSKDFPF